jgi:hypothetical protein
LLEFYKRVRGPEFPLDLLPRYHLTGMLEEDGQNLQGLPCDFDL